MLVVVPLDHQNVRSRLHRATFQTVSLGNSVNKEGKDPKVSLNDQGRAVAVAVGVAEAVAVAVAVAVGVSGGLAVVVSGGLVSGVATGTVFSTVLSTVTLRGALGLAGSSWLPLRSPTARYPTRNPMRNPPSTPTTNIP